MFGLLLGALLLNNSLALETTYSALPTPTASAIASPSGEVLSSDSSSVRENLQDAVAIRKAKIEEIRTSKKEEIDKKMGEFNTKLKTVKDAAQVTILQGLVEKFDAINVKWVDAWKVGLDKLSKILDKMDTSAADLKSSGKDITAYETAAKNARAKIADSEALLEEQAGNYYIFTVSSVSGLGKEVKDLSSQFKKDIQSTQVSVKAAKEAVKAAFAEFRKLTEEEILK